MEESSPLPKPSSTDKLKHAPKWSQTLGVYNSKPRGFTFVFIAGFNRAPIFANSKEIKHREEAIEFMINDPDRAKELCENDEKTKVLFPSIFATGGYVDKLKDMLKEYTDQKDNPHKELLNYWKEKVVGLDWVGDEYGFPYCVFVHSDFIGEGGIVKNLRTFHPNFGIRLHCGESLPLPRLGIGHSNTEGRPNPGEEAFETHISILYDCITRIQNGIKQNLRIGHGVAFLQENSEMAGKVRDYLIKNKIVCELNMTSNEYLLQSASYNGDRGELALPKFLAAGILVVLCTDDDGIWPIRKCKTHYHHVSVAGEFCKAIDLAGNYTNRDQLLIDADQVEQLIEAAKNARFQQT